MLKQIVLTFMVCAFVSALAENEFQSEFTETYTVPETENVVTWEGVTKSSKIRGAHGYDDTEDRRVLQRIKSVIAYSLAAKSKVNGAMPRSSSRPLFDMLKMMSEANKKKKNPVLAFATVMGALLSKYRLGMGKYLLSRVNNCVLKKGGLLTQFKKRGNPKTFVVLNHRQLGLRYKPKYFKHFTVSNSDYVRKLINLKMKGTSAVAAAAFLRKSTVGRFQGFLDQQNAYWGRKQANHIQANAAKAFGAQMKAYKHAKKKGAKKNGLIVPQTPAGIAASKKHHKTSGFHMPSPQHIRAIAKAKLAKFTKSQKKKHGAMWLVKAIEASLRGVTIRVSTKRKFGASSGNTPTIVFRGVKRKLTAKIDGCPPQGKTRTMHFPSKHDLGDLVDVSITGGNDLWYVNKIEVQMTAVGKWHTLSKRNFWVGRKTVTACVGKCAYWKRNQPTRKCSAACGLKAHTIHGSVTCHEEGSNKKISNLKCVHQRRSKPSRPSKGCRANAPCVRFITHHAPGCSSKCGQRAHNKHGSVQCQEVVSKKIVGHSKCHYWGFKTPAAPRRHCRATASCSYGTVYQHCNFGGYKKVLKHSTSWVANLGVKNDDLSSIKVPAGKCVTLYEHGGYKGRSWKICGKTQISCFTRHKMSGGKSWNDQVSSIRVSNNRL
jgi:hypothetical protein